MKRGIFKGARGRGDVVDATTVSLAALPRTLTAQQLSSMIAPASDPKTRMAAILMVAMNTGTVIDTKFFAFSRRRSTGGVDRPLPLYTNSTLLMAGAPHFVTMLGGGFAEDRIGSLDEGFPHDKDHLMDEYDYDSDSDLGDEYEDEPEDVHVTGEDAKDHSGAASSPLAAKHGKQPETDPIIKTDDDVHVPSTESVPMAAGERYGRIIALPTGAHKTWGALLFYLYTGGVQFAPLKSNPDQSKAKQQCFSPQCSPKSLYRLAQRYGLEALKKEAHDEIKAQLSTENIALELRSSFTSFHDDIRDMEVAFACEAAQLPRVLTGLSEWIANLARGETTHTADTLHALFQQITSTQTKKPHCTRCNASYPQRYFNCNTCGQVAQF
ncbi:hypothetical protein BC835DRAFT_587959 [Cytidiella melzeri]|nr:hypothetical protein BC835DRAFT_587959 [Cytidiella melzeri]